MHFSYQHGQTKVVIQNVVTSHSDGLLQNMKLVENVKALAQKKGVTASQMALAWLQHQVLKQRRQRHCRGCSVSAHAQLYTIKMQALHSPVQLCLLSIESSICIQ